MNEPYQHQPMEHSSVETAPATHEMMNSPASHQNASYVEGITMSFFVSIHPNYMKSIKLILLGQNMRF